MANKYVDVSATYNGDGTTSAQAASDGAVGAWNNLLNALSGSPVYGLLNAGDVVYVRTKNGTDLGESISGAVTLAATATAAAPISWVFDDGTVWVGDSGVFTLTHTSYNAFIVNNYHNIIASNYNFILEQTNTFGNFVWLALGNCVLNETKIITANTTGASYRIGGYNTQATPILVNPYLQLRSSSTTNNSVTLENGTSMTLLNPTIDITSSELNRAIFGHSYDGGSLRVVGGKLVGGNDTTHLVNLTAPTDSYARFEFDGFDPGTNTILSNRNTALSDCAGQAEMTLGNAPGGLYRAAKVRQNGSLDWTPGKNYPTLNAVLPDTSATPWSFKVYPDNGCDKGLPFEMPMMTKYYNLTAASKTITLEMLINAAITTPKTHEVFAVASWIDDTTGERKSISSFVYGNDLATSTAGWSASVYGAKTYNKHKIALTTTSNIKQNTEIQVQLYIGVAAANTDDYFFIDPDFILT